MTNSYLDLYNRYYFNKLIKYKHEKRTFDSFWKT